MERMILWRSIDLEVCQGLGGVMHLGKVARLFSRVHYP